MKNFNCKGPTVLDAGVCHLYPERRGFGVFLRLWRREAGEHLVGKVLTRRQFKRFLAWGAKAIAECEGRDRDKPTTT